MISTSNGQFITIYGTNAERTSIPPSTINPLTVFIETDTTNSYQWLGAWTRTGNNSSVAVISPSAAPTFFQQRATASAAALPNKVLVNGGPIYASSTNVGPIVIGDSTVTNPVDGTGNGYVLYPGTAFPAAAGNLNLYYIILGNGNTSSTDFVYCGGN